MSIGEFFNQSGYAFYVWWSFGATAGLIIVEWIFEGMHRKTVIRRLKRMARLNETQEKIIQ